VGADLSFVTIEEINGYLNRINYLLGDGHAAAVLLPDKLFPPSYTYHFQAVIRNWLGSTATSDLVLVTKGSVEVPVATIKGEGITKFVEGDETLTIDVALAETTCLGSSALKFEWTTVSKPEYFFGEVNQFNTKTMQSLYIPKGHLVPNATYTFQLNLTALPLGGGRAYSRVTEISVKVRPVPAPILLSAEFLLEDEMGYISLRFSKATNYAQMHVGSECSMLLTNSTTNLIKSGNVTALQCTWRNASHMVITWKGGPPTFSIGAAIRTRADVLKSQSNFKSFAPLMETLLTAKPYAPVVTLTAPSKIGVCNGIVLDASTSSRSGGRPFTVKWELVSVSGVPSLMDVEMDQIVVLLPQNSTALRVELPANVLIADHDYSFRVTLTNWFGVSGSAISSVSKGKQSLPEITVTDRYSMLAMTSRMSGVNYEITLSGSLCSEASNVRTWVWSNLTTAAWTPPWTLPLTPSLKIPPDTLIPGETYAFMLTVTDRGGVTNSETFSFVVDPVPTPSLIAAVFDSTMTGVLITFDSDTNTPGRGSIIGAASDNIFFCKEVLDVPSVAFLGDNSSCSWLSARTLRITLGQDYTLVSGSQLTCLPRRVYSLDKFSAPMGTAMVYVQGSADVPLPAPVVQGAPLVVYGACDDIRLDYSASTGGAGKKMTAQWTIVPSTYLTKLSTAEYAAIQSHLDTQTTSPLLIPADKIPGSRTYQLRLTLKNWVGGISNTTINVEKSPLDIPRVITTDTSNRVVDGRSDFQATIKVGPSKCTSAEDFHYSWVQLSGPRIVIPAASKSTEIFFIPRNTLQSNQEYIFRATISLKLDIDRKNTADVHLRVLSRDLEAVIAGGDRLFSIFSGNSLVLDGSKSNDPDIMGKSDSTLKRVWSCRISSLNEEGTPCFAEDLLASFELRGPMNNALTVPAKDLNPFASTGQTLIFSLSLTKEARRSETEVRITLTENRVPAASITMASDIAKVPGDKPLRLLGDATFKGANSFSYEWIVISNNLDLMDSSLLLTTRMSKDLVLKAGALQPGAQYEFALLVYVDNLDKPGKAYRTVVVNKAPTSGQCHSSPSTGLAYNTSFTLECSGWEDADLPLRYEYKIDRNGADINLLVAEGSNKCETMLSPEDNAIVAYVYDFYGAKSVVRFTVDVTSAPGLPDPAFTSRTLLSLSKSSNVTKNINQFSQSFLSLTSSLQRAKKLEEPTVQSRKRFLEVGDEATNTTFARVAVRREMTTMLAALGEDISVVTSDTLRQLLQMVAELLRDASEALAPSHAFVLN
jgi:hypothetical protein